MNRRLTTRLIFVRVAQFGVSGNPNVTRQVENAYLPDDVWNPSAGYSNVRGVVSFSSAYDTRGMAVNRTTELFINLANNSRLDSHAFVPVGYVVGNGMETVVERLYAGYGEFPDICAHRNESANPDHNTICKGPDEAELYARGNAYLATNYSKMDYVLVAYLDQSAKCCSPQASALLWLVLAALGLVCVVACLIMVRGARRQSADYARFQRENGLLGGFEDLHDEDEDGGEDEAA